jgi:hypothetical protein
VTTLSRRLFFGSVIGVGAATSVTVDAERQVALRTVWVLMWNDGDGDSASVFASELAANTELKRLREIEEQRAKASGPYYLRGGGYVYEDEMRGAGLV